MRRTTARVFAGCLVLLFVLGPSLPLLGDDTPAPVRHGRTLLSRNHLDCAMCHGSRRADAATTLDASWSGEGRVRISARAEALRYDSPTLDARFVGLSATSRACLTCHDGTIASPASPGTNLAADGLANDHPVGFAYDSQLASTDSGLRDPAFAPSGLGGTIESDLLDRGTLQCTSCHVFHAESTRKAALLRISITGSELCLTCHDK